MALKTRSAFTYGHTFDDNNQFIDFSEDGGATELVATIEIGSYTLNQLTDKIAQALNEIGDNEYTVTLDRATRKYTISADNPFQLLVTSGTHSAINAFTLLGFTADKTGGSSYESDVASGSIYYPQAPLKDYTSFDDIEEAAQARVNESSDGSTVEVVSFGTRNFMECNIKYATDILGQVHIEENPNGVALLRTFMQYITKKRPIEFIPDRDNLAVFSECLLESTPRSRDGVGFQLRELYAEKLAFYFETGRLIFRRL
jgi:hypothetical protein